MRRCAELCAGAVLAATLLPARAAAQTPATSVPANAGNAPLARGALIEVEREPGAEACPDTAAVFRSIERLFPERAFRPTAELAQSAASAHVVIRAVAGGFQAVLSMRTPQQGERVIFGKDEHCRGLDDALALAFVMLAEPPESAPPPTPDSHAPVPTPEAAPNVPAPTNVAVPPASDDKHATREPTSRRPHAFHVNTEASALGGFGFLSKPAAGATFGFELFHRTGFSATLAGTRLWSPRANADGGSVRLSVWALLAGLCYGRRFGVASALDACVRFGAGRQVATVAGFSAPKSGYFPWTLLVPSVGYRVGLSASLAGFVRIGPVVQLRPQSFSVFESSESFEGYRAVATAPNIGAMAELGLSLRDFGF